MLGKPEPQLATQPPMWWEQSKIWKLLGGSLSRVPTERDASHPAILCIRFLLPPPPAQEELSHWKPGLFSSSIRYWLRAQALNSDTPVTSLVARCPAYLWAQWCAGKLDFLCGRGGWRKNPDLERLPVSVVSILPLWQILASDMTLLNTALVRDGYNWLSRVSVSQHQHTFASVYL